MKTSVVRLHTSFDLEQRTEMCAGMYDPCAPYMIQLALQSYPN